MNSRRSIVLLLLGPFLLTQVQGLGAQDGGRPNQALPPELAPLEFLVGQWKGQGVPRDDPARRFRGWTETHTWAWVFAKGKPVGLSLSVEGGKRIARATLTYDPGHKRYRLEGKAPAAGPGFLYLGTLDSGGKRLILESPGKQGTERLALRANSNYLRYTLLAEQKGEDALTFAPRFEVGLTRKGESFAAGSSAAERPRCIVTCGTATMSVSHQGRDYPICCTGCRDEFNDNPEKYLKKLAARSQGQGDSKGQPKTPSKVSRFEDAFADDVSEDPPGSGSRDKPAPKVSPRKDRD